MAILGTDVILYYYNGSSNVAFSSATNCSLQTSMELMPVSSSSSAWAAEYKPDLTSWTVDCDGLLAFDGFDFEDFLNLQYNRTQITIKFTVNTSPAYTITGLANIQSVSYSGDVNGVATYSVSFQGCKRYTIA
jgi:predicted secreted protein